jgi:hypothetical protein
LIFYAAMLARKHLGRHEISGTCCRRSRELALRTAGHRQQTRR